MDYLFDARRLIYPIEGLNAGTEYEIIYFPTRMGSYFVPSSYTGTAFPCSSSTGCLQVPVNFTLGCDTTNSDFAFVVQPTTPLSRVISVQNTLNNLNLPDNISILPNLTSGKIEIKSTVSDKYFIEIYDVNGKLVHMSTFSGGNKNIDIISFPRSIYILKLYSSTKVFIQKIALQ